ncbi:LADA_0G04522g1_1 [Lachancea dasiensis]|uniref:LADA_0G04522g1_1 n=1 Tax=Lachancea dasiensis TaxID=1072105 RepID=A0A1G4JSM6_9SACH|nr:LADA_0G04522g1_1 [Lachancea dasiensis]
MGSSDSGSDSDFGDFEGISDSDEPIQLSWEEQLDSILGPRQEISHTNQKHDLAELIEGERPKVVYEQLVLVEPHLRAFQWRHSKLRSELLHTLQIEDVPVVPKITKSVDTSLFDLLEPYLGAGTDQEHKSKDISKVLGNKVHASEHSSPPLSSSIVQLQAKDLDDLEEEELTHTHDQLIDAISVVCKSILQNEELRTQLIADKEMFEDLVTNLVGHTQRLRRDEIAQFNKKNRRSFKYGKKFKWAR